MLSNGLRGDASDMHGFVDQFAADAELWLPPTANTQSPCRGRDAIRRLLVDDVMPRYRDGLRVTLHGMLMAPGSRALPVRRPGHASGRHRLSQQSLHRAGSRRRADHPASTNTAADRISSSSCLDPAATGDDVDAVANAVAIAAVDELAHGLGGDPASLGAFLARLAPERAHVVPADT